jgi:hypothetical protein
MDQKTDQSKKKQRSLPECHRDPSAGRQLAAGVEQPYVSADWVFEIRSYSTPSSADGLGFGANAGEIPVLKGKLHGFFQPILSLMTMDAKV